jgi:high affinity Mn2+ porin
VKLKPEALRALFGMTMKLEKILSYLDDRADYRVNSESSGWSFPKSAVPSATALLGVLLARVAFGTAASPVPATPDSPAHPICQIFPTSDDECQPIPVDDVTSRFVARFQTTYLWSHKSAFDAPYTGPQSLLTRAETSYTLSATAYLGARLWQGGELYVNPEAFQGHPFSSLFGLAGVQNGELQKASGEEIRAYIARLILRQTFNFGKDAGGSGEGERYFNVEEGLNQLATHYSRRRFVMTLGKVSIIDLFEKSTYANDPRSQFMNWALITYGAYDFAGDARGYNIGGSGELYWDDWVVRAGRYMEPTVANGRSLHYNLFRYHGDQLEIEHDHELLGHPGIVRALVFHNVANAGSYQDAINQALLTGQRPDVTAVRHTAAKTGYGLSVEQTLSPSVALWGRAMYADDRVEEYAFAEIDNSVSAGISVKGLSWGRRADTFGAAFSSDGLNRDHRDYLALGGLGGFLGDGQLNRSGRELVSEVYYNALAYRYVHLTLDYQRIENPAYNVERHGPVNIVSGRVHVEF